MTSRAPGVYTKETDLSYYVPAVSASICAILGSASKGPVNEVTLITDEAQLIDTFGPPSGTHYGLFAAQAYLRRGNQCKFVRIADYDLTADADLEQYDVRIGSISAVSTGSWGNDISVAIAEGTEANAFKITVKYGDVVAEVFDMIKIGADNEDDVNYITTRINGVSDYITITLDEVPEWLDYTEGTDIDLAGGWDGTPISSEDFIGTAGTPPTVLPTGLYLFEDSDDEVIDLLLTPGITELAGVNAYQVMQAAISLCETRGDCIYLFSTPQDLSVLDAVKWLNGLSADVGAPTAAINSSYAACYYNWLTVSDNYNDEDNATIMVPPEGHVAACFAYTDDVAEPWFAPAGISRGKVLNVLEIEHSPSNGEMTYMYNYGNCLNPIVNYPYVGTVIWGQRTTQRASTALDRINVRRMLNYIKRAIAYAIRPLVFEPNDSDTWERALNICDPILRDVASKRGIDAYTVICDSTTNTDAVISRNEMVVKILVEPTKTAEVITLDFVLLPTGSLTLSES